MASFDEYLRSHDLRLRNSEVAFDIHLDNETSKVEVRALLRLCV